MERKDGLLISDFPEVRCYNEMFIYSCPSAFTRRRDIIRDNSWPSMPVSSHQGEETFSFSFVYTGSPVPYLITFYLIIQSTQGERYHLPQLNLSFIF